MGELAIPYGYTAESKTFPSYSDNRHLCTVGPARSGKGQIIISAMLQVAIRSSASMPRARTRP